MNKVVSEIKPNKQANKIVKPNQAVGDRLPLVDGIEKVSGKAEYSADLDSRGALVGLILRSPCAHGEITRLDLSAARALPGVAAVISGDDCCAPFGILPISENEFPLVKGKVRYRGDAVAAVAAVDIQTAKQALALIELEIKELPAYFTAEEALKPDAVLIHEDRKGNLERTIFDEFGSAEQGFQQADLVQEESFHCNEVTHAHMEPHAALADYDVER
ncbi:MAG: 4-hydroxybenzoyl-CoA reductase subunit alpha, partial [Gammaproteobacteria bacterium]